jgi:dUTP pyrophosphatase
MLKLRHKGLGDIFYATTMSAGFDVTASESVLLEPGQWKLVPTGLFIEEAAAPFPLTTMGFPGGMGLSSSEGENASEGANTDFESSSNTCTVMVLPELQLRPRSGLAVKHGIGIVNSPSTIDADYRGEIKVPLINHGKVVFEVKAGERIAQAVCALIFHAPQISIRDVERGTGGFGSTGTESKLT